MDQMTGRSAAVAVVADRTALEI